MRFFCHSQNQAVETPMRLATLLFLMMILGSSTAAVAQVEKNPPQKPEATPAPEKVQTQKVLFVGNSFTFWRGGLDQHLKILSQSMSPELGYETKAVTRGGASLEVMWKRTSAAEEIRNGKYDVVILQEDIPETTVESFQTYSKKFVDLVRESGARPILFMAWDYQRLNWISMKEIAEAHFRVGKSLKVEVAPVGFAWALCKERQPALNLYTRDAEHPSVAGMYLSLLVIESTISGKSPLTRAPKKLEIPGLQQLNEKGRNFLREVARDALAEWKKKN